jgi:hypothetical protein
MNLVSLIPVCHDIQMYIMYYVLEATPTARAMKEVISKMKRWSPFTQLGVKLYRSYQEMWSESRSPIYKAEVWRDIQEARISLKMRQKMAAGI